jgi:hypothetical protein
MDEPFFFAHVYDGANACHWDVAQVARSVDHFIQAMRSILPGVVIGDIEPLSGAADAQAYGDWLDTFQSVNGYHPAFLHMDVDWSRPDWPQRMSAIEDHGRQIGVPVGIIYIGNAFDETDQAWFYAAGQRVKKYELDAGGQPDQVLFQSWVDKPDHVLPETTPYTFTNFIDAYFGDKSNLGPPTQGAGADLALGKRVLVSRQLSDRPGSLAVDGDDATFWSAGDLPPQWIQIDLGAPHNIKEFHLMIAQSPAGRTVHRLTGRGPDPGESWILLHTFDGSTSDGQTLTNTSDAPLQGIQYVRVETVTSPSWVAWREIEVIGQ